MQQAKTGHAVVQHHEVARAELPFEFMLNALRLREGVQLAMLTERTGLPTSAFKAALEQADAKGLLARDGKNLWPTERGFDFLSDLQALFLP
jgi:oxygen-independent coproporphyrinogen-3 oxidase